MQQIKAIGILFTITISLIGATIIVSISLSPVSADANCEKAGPGPNKAGNIDGNIKQCVGGDLGGPKEPLRSDESPSCTKDNNGDGTLFCKNRGNN